MGNYSGVIIEESLENKDVLKKIKIIKTKIEAVTENHKTPWIKQWTLHNIEIAEGNAESLAKEISLSLDSRHNWYADFKNNQIHYIIFKNKIFKIHRDKKEEYDKATAYGVSIGIPEYQVDFSPHVKVWKR